ncbi:MAG: hypothetical protein QMD22_05300 [archaeon]|nr:hypothetical protein [archaeon]
MRTHEGARRQRRKAPGRGAKEGSEVKNEREKKGFKKFSRVSRSVKIIKNPKGNTSNKLTDIKEDTINAPRRETY